MVGLTRNLNGIADGQFDQQMSTPQKLVSRGYEEFEWKGVSSGPQSGIPFWGDVPTAWSKCKLGQFDMPGISKVTGKCSNKNDKKHIPGTHGATFTHIGYEPAKVEIEVTIWTPDHLKRMRDIIDAVRPRKATPQAVDISHPGTMLLGISSVLVMDVDLPVYDEHNDSVKVKFKCEEYVGQGAQQANIATVNQSTSLLGNAIDDARNNSPGVNVAAGTNTTAPSVYSSPYGPGGVGVLSPNRLPNP